MIHADLGVLSLGVREVAGSNPVVPTNKDGAVVKSAALSFRAMVAKWLHLLDDLTIQHVLIEGADRGF